MATKRILIAEDNLTLAKGLADLLRKRSFAVTTRSDGAAALQEIAASPPDLLLLDLRLPGLHGIELLKKLRRSPQAPDLPVIIMSGVYKGEKYRQAAHSLGVEHYLEKPFRAKNMINAVEKVLGASQPALQPVRRHLQEAFRQRFSGRIILSWPDCRRTLVFFEGAPVSLQPGFTHKDFGVYLLTRRLLDGREYAYCTRGGSFHREGPVELGCLTYPELMRAELDYLGEELEQAFGAPPAAASHEKLAFPAELRMITLNVPNLFYHGFRRFAGQAGKRLLARHCNHYPVPSGDYFRYINFLDLSEEDKGLLQRMNGQNLLADCLDGRHEPFPLLLSLLSLNMLTMSPTPVKPAESGSQPVRTLFNAVAFDEETVEDAPLENFTDLVGEEPATQSEGLEARTIDQSAAVAGKSSEAAPDDLAQAVRFMAQSLEGKNHYEVFGIKPARFSIGLLKERYFAITRKFGPEILMQLGGEEAGMVEGLLSRVATAYDTLSDIVKKERYDELLNSEKIGLGREGDDRFQAQVQAESGKVFIEMEEWDNAEKALQEAVDFDSNNGEILAHLAWSVARNPRHAESRAMQAKARQMLNKALAMERTAQGFAYKGWLLMEAGQEVMAEAEFGKALRIDARQAMARRGLRTIREKQEQQKKGLFKRMFK
ncbi:MAG TPA: response regulator [Desulfuromonadales bacterium]|nr:response regulator [Desulfuromonadales bacterium]